MPPEIRLRLIVVGAPSSVTFCMQRGKNELLSPSRTTHGEISFEFTLRVGEPLSSGRPRLLGPFAQGSPDARFLYVNSGTFAGQAESCWSRRAKVPLTGITAQVVESLLAAPEAALEVRIVGTAGDGGPCCASVPLLRPGWTIVGTR